MVRAERAIRRGSLDGVRQLERAITKYLADWNENAEPFRRTRSAQQIRRSICHANATYETGHSRAASLASRRAPFADWACGLLYASGRVRPETQSVNEWSAHSARTWGRRHGAAYPALPGRTGSDDALRSRRGARGGVRRRRGGRCHGHELDGLGSLRARSLTAPPQAHATAAMHPPATAEVE